MNPTILTALDAIHAATSTLPALREAEALAWRRATLATQERMETLHTARTHVARALDAGLPFEAAIAILDRNGLLPISEVLLYTRAHREGRLDVPRFSRYLRTPSNIQSTPEDNLLTPQRRAAALLEPPSLVVPDNIPTKSAPEDAPLPSFRAPIPDFTTAPTPSPF